MAKFPKIDPNTSSDVYIWDVYFYVNVPVMAMVSNQYINEVGLPISGDKRKDKDLLNAWQQSYLSINQIVEIVRKGYTVSVKEADTKIMYDYIQHHLKKQIELLNTAYEPDSEIVEDLMALDQLGTLVYPYAKPMFDGVRTTSDFMNAIKGMPTKRAGFLAPFDPKLAETKKRSKWDKPEEVKPEEVPDVMEGHKSMSSELNSILNRSYYIKPE